MLAAVTVASLLAHGNVTWQAPPTCPSSAVLTGRLLAYLGETDADFTAAVTVSETPAGYEAAVRVETPEGAQDRLLQAQDCTMLADAAALVIAVDVDVLAVAAAVPTRSVVDAPPPPTAPPSPPPRTPATRDAPQVEPQPPPRRRARRARVGARIDAGLGLGALPAANLVVGLSAAVLWRHWRLELGGTHHFSRPARLDPPNEAAGADVRHWAGLLRGRWVPRAGGVEFPISVGVELGDAIADGRGVSGARTRHSLWGAALLGAGLALVPHPRLALWLDPSLVLAVARPRFAVAADSAGPLLAHQASIAGFRAALGFEVRFP